MEQPKAETSRAPSTVRVGETVIFINRGGLHCPALVTQLPTSDEGIVPELYVCIPGFGWQWYYDVRFDDTRSVGTWAWLPALA